MSKEWCRPAEADPLFVARMEDVLDVYARPVDPRRPVVCFDESGKELRAPRRPDVPPAPGQPARQDCEYQRQGSASLLLWCAPHEGRRQVTVTTQRTRVEFANALRDLVDVHFPDAERIVLVLDNLNTHSPAALYYTFPPAEAKRIWDKLEIHYPPIHASWLNAAECELHALTQQCLNRRIPDQATLTTEVAAWVAARNAAHCGVDWHFTTADARIKLKRLYPIPVYAN